jgi:hypothetical protein
MKYSYYVEFVPTSQQHLQQKNRRTIQHFHSTPSINLIYISSKSCFNFNTKMQQQSITNIKQVTIKPNYKLQSHHITVFLHIKLFACFLITEHIPKPKNTITATIGTTKPRTTSKRHRPDRRD